MGAWALSAALYVGLVALCAHLFGPATTLVVLVTFEIASSAGKLMAKADAGS